MLKFIRLKNGCPDIVIAGPVPQKNLLVERTSARLLTLVIHFLQACACALNKLMWFGCEMPRIGCRLCSAQPLH